jgi:hypothetical protein
MVASRRQGDVLLDLRRAEACGAAADGDPVRAQHRQHLVIVKVDAVLAEDAQRRLVQPLDLPGTEQVERRRPIADRLHRHLSCCVLSRPALAPPPAAVAHRPSLCHAPGTRPAPIGVMRPAVR